MLALGRPLFAAMVAVVTSFIVALWVSQRHLSNIEDEVYAIATNAEPSIQHLSTARSELERVGIYSDEYLEATSTGLSTAPSSRNAALQARNELDRAIAAYGQLPFFPGEEELYTELRAALDPVRSAFGDVLERAGGRDILGARQALARDLHPNIERADRILSRIVDLDTAQVQQHLAAIQASRHRGATMAIGLGTLGLVISCIAAGLALRAVAREASRQQVVERERTVRACAEEAVRLRDDFLALASHELRTPLTSLQLSMQALQRTSDGSPAMLARAQQQARRMGDLVEELVDVAQIHLGRVRLDPSEVDLTGLVRDVAASRSGEAEQARSTVMISGDAPIVGQWDRGHLAHVISALLSNAFKFGAGAPVEVAVTQHDGFAQLTVRDHGIGIPQGRLPFVFDLFERAVPATNYGGLGLGLYVVRELVEAHGGCACVESEVGSGSTFTIDLPLGKIDGRAPRIDQPVA